MPNDSGAVRRIGPAIWVTASATTSSRRLELGEDRRGAGIISLADLGRRGAARGAGEQARAQLLLEPRDAARQAGLGQAHALGGAREGAGFRDPDEAEHVDQVGRGAFHISQHHDVDCRSSDNAQRA